MILPISALARSSCNAAELFLKSGSPENLRIFRRPFFTQKRILSKTDAKLVLGRAAVAGYGACQKSFFSKFGETACFLPKSFSQMAIVKQLVKDLYCSQERSVREHGNQLLQLDPEQKPSPLGGKVAATKGSRRMRGTDKQQRKVRPHQSPAVTASPDRGKPSCGKLISVVREEQTE